MGIKIVTDSTCDFSLEELKKYNVEMLPLKVIFENEEFKDKIEMSPDEFYKKLRTSSKLPSTSQVNPGEFLEVFERLLEEDKDATIIVPLLSSNLSGTYASAGIAKGMIENNQNIHIFDTHSASFGEGSIILKLIDYINEGLSIDEILDKLEDLKRRSVLIAALDTMENLKKGGRLSATKAIIGAILGVKPIIEVVDGKVVFKDKVRKFDKALDYLLDQLREAFPNKQIPYLSLAASNSHERIQSFRERVESEFEVERLEVFHIGPVIGVHTAEGAVGIHFFK